MDSRHRFPTASVALWLPGIDDPVGRFLDVVIGPLVLVARAAGLVVEDGNLRPSPGSCQAVFDRHGCAPAVPNVVDDQNAFAGDKWILRKLHEEGLLKAIVWARVEHYRGNQNVTHSRELAYEGSRYHATPGDDQQVI